MQAASGILIRIFASNSLEMWNNFSKKKNTNLDWSSKQWNCNPCLVLHKEWKHVHFNAHTGERKPNLLQRDYWFHDNRKHYEDQINCIQGLKNSSTELYKLNKLNGGSWPPCPDVNWTNWQSTRSGRRTELNDLLLNGFERNLRHSDTTPHPG